MWRGDTIAQDRVSKAIALELEIWAPTISIRLIAIACIYLTEDTLTHIRVCHDVDSLVALAIVHTRKLGIVRELIEYLDTVYSLRRERVKRRRDILAEELLTVDKDLLYLLALSLNRAVGDGNTRHLLQETLDIGVSSNLEGSSIIGQRIAILRGTHSLHLLDNGLDSHARRELHNTKVSCALNRNILTERCVADKGNGHCVLAISHRSECHAAASTRSVVLAHIRVCLRRELDNSTHHALLGLHIDNLGNKTTLCKGRNCHTEHKNN